MKALILLLQWLDRLLQLLVPPSQARLCYRSAPDYTDNPYFVYRHALRTRNNLEHVWLLADLTLAGRIREEFERETRRCGTTGNSLVIAHLRSVAGYWHHLRSTYVFHSHGCYRICAAALRGRSNVCLWHGMPIKCIGRLNQVTPNPYPTFGTVHVATSHLFRYVIAAAFAVPLERVLLAPLPRADALRPDHIALTATTALRRALHIPEQHPIVLWLPTFRSEPRLTDAQRRSFLDEVPSDVFAALAEACAAADCTLVIKLHLRDLLNEAPPPAVGPAVRFVTAPAWQATGIQLYELVAASAALLSDISSVVIDYLPTGRPIGLFALDEERYPRDFVFPPGTLLRSARCRRIATAADAREFVAAAARGTPVTADQADVSHLLHDHFPEGGSERILRHVGL